MFIFCYTEKETLLEKETKVKKNAILAVTVISLLFLPLTMLSQETVGPELKNIIVQKTAGRLEAKLETSTPVKYETFSLVDPDRLIIDLFQVKTFSSPSLIEVDAVGVKAIRTAVNRPEVVRVVFDLDRRPPAYSIRETDGGILVVFTQEEGRKETPPPPVGREEKPPATSRPVPAGPEVPRMREIPAAGVEGRQKTFSFGLNSGAYFVHSADFQEVYGKQAPFGGAEAGLNLPISDFDSIGVQLSFNYIPDKGKTTFTQEEVTLTLLPLSLAVSYSKAFGSFMPFVGVAVDYFNYKENFPETFTVPSVSGTALGFNFQLGTYLKIMDSLTVKLYFKFHSAKSTKDGLDINLGGNEYGLGLVYSFKL